MMRGLLCLLVVAWLSVPGAARAAEPESGDHCDERSALVIETNRGERHRFSVEVADRPSTREVGLMHRQTLAVDHGMLFDFGSSSFVSMWMKNTHIPLDMLFIDSGGRVVRIAERTTPFSLETLESGQPVRAVLEINGGLSDRMGLAAGDVVRHPLFC